MTQEFYYHDFPSVVSFTDTTPPSKVEFESTTDGLLVTASYPSEASGQCMIQWDFVPYLATWLIEQFHQQFPKGNSTGMDEDKVTKEVVDKIKDAVDKADKWDKDNNA